jgi:hypothetical protein
MAIRVPRPFRTPLTEAEFSYTVDQDVIKVVDLNLGSNSVTNDAERVLRKIEQWQPGLIARCRNLGWNAVGRRRGNVLRDPGKG